MPPSTIKKRKLTVADAADQWEQASRDAKIAKTLVEEAAEVLLAHFARTGRSSYKGRIGLTSPSARTVLDQAKVRAFLAGRLPEFQRVSTPKPGLTLLGGDDQP